MLSSALLLIGSILFIGAGIFCIVQPAESLLAVGYYIGFVIVLGGVCQLLRFFKSEPEERSLWHLLISILDIAFGLWMVVSVGFAAVAYLLPLLFALYILIRGLFMIILRTKKKAALKSPDFYMGAAIIQIILVLRPDAAGLLFMYMVALALIWTGISTFLTWRKKENLDE
ncbi:HdeD family acid-resistance protein [uncultured Dialister sp.]|jgi:uncharacterized membrane protein HdeD (DUF308 family)|uniref:HdeD family acid-resistance protein n=1 Tax=uncultured Dialister sp. TaxID=278064 RepID=UPI00262F7636|nr:DUF308 domain-containing protein [uncultured Dialister sp.]